MTPSQWTALTARVHNSIRRLEADGSRRFDPAHEPDFGYLLSALAAPGVTDEQTAVRAALAVVAREGLNDGAPPPSLTAGLDAALLGPAFRLVGAKPTTAPLRAVEAVCATLLGAEVGANWRIDRGRSDWTGLAAGAYKIVRRHILGRVTRCLNALKQDNPCGGVIGFPTLTYEDCIRYADRLMDRLVRAERNACRCWGFARGRSPQHKEKFASCLRHHHLPAWRPDTYSLWQYLRKAVQGSVVGHVAHESFPAGMLNVLLREDSYELLRCRVVRRDCSAFGHQTVYLRCNHPDGAFKPAMDLLRLRKWLVLRRNGVIEGGFVAGRYLTCRQEHVFEASLPICPVCGSPKTLRGRRVCAFAIPEQATVGQKGAHTRKNSRWKVNS